MKMSKPVQQVSDGDMKEEDETPKGIELARPERVAPEGILGPRRRRLQPSQRRACRSPKAKLRKNLRIPSAL